MTPLAKNQIPLETRHLVQNWGCKPCQAALRKSSILPITFLSTFAEERNCTFALSHSVYGPISFWYISQPNRQKGHSAILLLDFCAPWENLSHRAAFLHRDSIWHLWFGFLTNLCPFLFCLQHSEFVLSSTTVTAAPMLPGWSHSKAAGTKLRLKRSLLPTPTSSIAGCKQEQLLEENRHGFWSTKEHFCLFVLNIHLASIWFCWTLESYSPPTHFFFSNTEETGGKK